MRPIPYRTLVERFGRPARRFDRIAVQLDWSTVEYADVDRFCHACKFPVLGDKSQQKRFFERQMALPVPFLFLGKERARKLNRLCIRLQAREAMLLGGLTR